MNDNRLANITNFVKNRLDEWHRINPQPDKDPVYRYGHTLRVSQYDRQLSQSEGADIELVIAACLLHDVAHFDPQVSNPEHGRAGGRSLAHYSIRLGTRPMKWITSAILLSHT